MLLRRVWNSFRKHSSSSQYEEDSEWEGDSPAEKLSADVFYLIGRRLGAKDCARAALVCRTWRDSVDDERLWKKFMQEEYGEMWPATLFAETFLRDGPRLRFIVPNAFPHLPLRLIYRQREQLQGSVIVDGGIGYCKFGWSQNSEPSGRSATFLEFANIESPMYSRLRHFFSTVYGRLQVKPSTQPIVISTPISHCDDTQSAKAARRQLREAIYQVLFDMNVSTVCAIDQAVLALFAARQTSGIVVNIGFQVTSIVPILHGKVMRNVGVEVVGQGALRLTGYLSELMRSNGIDFNSMYIVRTLKENLCYVAEDYCAELSKNTEASFKIGNEGVFTLSRERFQTAEILFQPQLGGIRAMSLHRAVALCIDHCHAYEVDNTADEGWFKTVVLAGGSACLPGLAERLEKELHRALPSSISNGIKVLPPPYGANSAWFGAKIVSNMSTFPQVWCITKKQFRKNPGSIHAMALDDE